MALLGGADVVVVRAVEPLDHGLEARDVAVDELARREPFPGRGLQHLDAVLVGAGQEKHVVAVEPHEARDRVGRDRLVGVADMRRAVRVGDRGRDVVAGLVGHRTNTRVAAADAADTSNSAPDSLPLKGGGWGGGREPRAPRFAERPRTPPYPPPFRGRKTRPCQRQTEPTRRHAGVGINRASPRQASEDREHQRLALEIVDLDVAGRAVERVPESAMPTRRALSGAGAAIRCRGGGAGSRAPCRRRRRAASRSRLEPVAERVQRADRSPAARRASLDLAAQRQLRRRRRAPARGRRCRRRRRAAVARRRGIGVRPERGGRGGDDVGGRERRAASARRQRERMVGKQPARRVAHQQEQRARRRLLQHLEQRIGAFRLLELVGGIDDADPPAALARGRAEEAARCGARRRP